MMVTSTCETMTPRELVDDHFNPFMMALYQARLQRVADKLSSLGMSDEKIGLELLQAKRIGEAYGHRHGMVASGLDSWPGIDAQAVQDYLRAGWSYEALWATTIYAEVAFWAARQKVLFHLSPLA